MAVTGLGGLGGVFWAAYRCNVFKYVLSGEIVLLGNNAGGIVGTVSKGVISILIQRFLFLKVGGSASGAGGTCTSTILLGQSCTVNISFDPTATGYKYAYIDVHFEVGNSGDISFSQTLRGLGN